MDQISELEGNLQRSVHEACLLQAAAVKLDVIRQRFC